MKESSKPEINGLLPHESVYVRRGLGRAALTKRDADLAYGQAVADSGGDWAFDDAASQVAAEAAHIAEMRVRGRKNLADLPAIEYPDEQSEAVEVGSRVTLRVSYGNDVYDVASRLIAGMPADNEVVILSAESPLGAVLLGKKLEDIVEWKTPKGVLRAVVTGIDQVAQREFYNGLAITE